MIPGFIFCRVETNPCRTKSGLIIIHDRVVARHGLSIDGCRVDVEDSELDLINRLVDVVREFDPDILTGYEVQSSSWGYIIERGRLHYGNTGLYLNV